MRGFIDECKAKCLAGEALSRAEIISLLSVEIGSADDEYLRSAAREAAEKIAGGRGYIWCAVGMDYAPCSMNCKFCSFGEKWGIVREPRHVGQEEIFSHVRQYAENGAAYIILRTTEFYDLDRLLGFIPEIRAEIPGGYAIVLNTGELDAAAAAKAKAAGVYGVYHALRLREGTDTPFNPAERIATMKNVSASGMTLVSLVEPLGCEHTDEEIADSFLNAAACGAKICGAMARFPVEGTPFGSSPMISGPRLALALDEPLDSDDVIEEAGFRFCINKELLAQIKGVSIGISYMGFTLDPEVPLASSGDSGSCGSCTSCGSH